MDQLDKNALLHGIKHKENETDGVEPEGKTTMECSKK